jgi:predicted AlkP superfamily phosphohydrolase/phosphomutase
LDPVNSETVASLAAHQVVVVGIDSAPWSFVDHLIDEGRLPNLERMKKEGAYGTLRSTPCYVTPPAWQSMFSGYAPAKTGIYTFGKWNREAEKFDAVTASDAQVPSVWDVASQAGKKVAVTNIPLTYPVRPVNGIMVSGLMSPVPLLKGISLETTNYTSGLTLSRVAPDVRSFSKTVKTEGSDSLNTITWWRVDSTDDDRVNYDLVVLTVAPRISEERQEVTGRVYTFAIGDYSPWINVRAVWRDKVRDGWCKFQLFQRTDGRYQAVGSQILFDSREAGAQYTYPEDLAQELSDRFGYYMPSKFLDKEVVPAVTLEAAKYASFFYDYDDWDLYSYVFTQSDNIHHLDGFSERAAQVYETIDRFLGELMDRLPEESTLIVASDHGSRKFEWGIDLNEFLEQLGLLVRKPDGDDIDYGHTIVFHNMWHLYFNHDLLTPDNLRKVGITVESSESPEEALISYLKKAQIRLTEGNQRYPLEFSLISGDFVGDGPDALVEGVYDNYTVEFWNLKRPRGQLMRRLTDSEAHKHTRDGIFVMWGKHVSDGYDAGLHQIEDIAPTILYLLGLPAAEDMDGSGIFDALVPSFVASQTSYTVSNYREISRDFIAAEKDTEPFEKKLKSLGYVD